MVRIFLELSLSRFFLGFCGRFHLSFTLKIMFNQKMVGMIGQHAYHKGNKSIATGYWLDADHQGKGIITQATQAVCAYLFATNPRWSERVEPKQSSSRAAHPIHGQARSQ